MLSVRESNDIRVVVRTLHPVVFRVSTAQLLIWGEDENFEHSPSWSLFHPLCQMYWYHWQQSRARCYHHHHACTCVVFLGLKASPLSLLIIKLSLSMWAAANFNWAWKCQFWRGFLTWSEPFSPRGCKTHFTGQWHFVLAVCAWIPHGRLPLIWVWQFGSSSRPQQSDDTTCMYVQFFELTIYMQFKELYILLFRNGSKQPFQLV